MKKTLIKLGICMMTASLALTGCSKNTQNENTTLGAVSGGVLGGLAGSAIGAGTGQAVAIGVGIVGGALLGGYIGHSMDSSDQTRMNSAMDNSTNQSSTWKNSKTGNTYTVAPTSKMMTVNGNPNCRQFTTKAIINGKTKNVHGVACRQSDGTWHAVNS